MHPTDSAVSVTQSDGPFLRKHREFAGLTLTAVADAAGISKGYLSKIENGKAQIDITMVVRIADAIAEASRRAA